MLEVSHVSKSYGQTEVLHDISFSVLQGEIVCITGPSGVGKSTLFRAIAQLDTNFEGSICINGYSFNGIISNNSKANIQKQKAAKREVGIVFQNYHLFPHLNVEKNICLTPMIVYHFDYDKASALARKVLKQMDLSDKIHAFPSQLSGGQQQRVAIARALAMSPQLMLFDEPTSALDPEITRNIVEVIRQLASDGMTVLCVSHDEGFVDMIADKILLLKSGNITIK